jgi:hypothetical protein
LFTDILGQPVISTFKGQAVKEYILEQVKALKMEPVSLQNISQQLPANTA